MRRLALPLALLLLFAGCSTASIDLDTRRAPAGLHLDVVRITETENFIQVTLELRNDSARSFVYPSELQARPDVRVQYLTEAAWVDKTVWVSCTPSQRTALEPGQRVEATGVVLRGARQRRVRLGVADYDGAYVVWTPVIDLATRSWGVKRGA